MTVQLTSYTSGVVAVTLSEISTALHVIEQATNRKHSPGREEKGREAIGSLEIIDSFAAMMCERLGVPISKIRNSAHDRAQGLLDDWIKPSNTSGEDSK